ncbi:hypothetical protein VSH64_29075 [Amycolatopsis rhabdoformis]|uniref:Uncharacterized protein n=1 Tax=Amycolatopsis rhabdoformis TaxID=1448059 RepID=A0ABZ1HZI6_9PSEU|nr:hypothetical protein [Amycolatopsis rhabdoformis]WSE26921.1 hypothetical protein VSH64_29075 [Amycolatopsis rhabdoformis]
MEFVATGRHRWLPSEAVMTSAHSYLRSNAPKIADSMVEIATKSFVASAWSTEKPASTAPISVEDLHRSTEDLAKAAVLVVEDLSSDGNFIRALAKIFNRTVITEALTKRWLVIRHSGGERLEVVARDERQNFNNIVRVVALLDSDKWTSNLRTKSHNKADRLRRQGVKVHVLDMREAENYAPNKILALCGNPAESSRKLGHLKRLDREQRAHFDMKHGFGQVNRPPTIREEQKVLYGSLPDSTVKGLRGGFGTQILRIFEEHSHIVREIHFEDPAIGARKEINELLLKIQEVL